jgi:hypothetical protein
VGTALHAGLRPLTGAEELLVHEAVAAGTARAVITTRLLAAALEPSGEARALDLSVGQRETLLLRLRQSAFGERIEAVVACPYCREPLDLELQTADFLAAAAEPVAEAVEVDLHVDGMLWRARLRPVSGADQTEVLGTADPVTALLRRCVLDLVRDDGVAWPVEEASPALRQALDAALRDMDPNAEIRLDLACPACGERLGVPFDAAGHFFAELAAEGDLLLREIAALARTFHWREQDILALPRGRRKAYAALAAGR